MLVLKMQLNTYLVVEQKGQFLNDLKGTYYSVDGEIVQSTHKSFENFQKYLSTQQGL